MDNLNKYHLSVQPSCHFEMRSDSSADFAGHGHRLSDNVTVGVCLQDTFAAPCAKGVANHGGYSCCKLDADEVRKNAVLT